MTEQKNNYSNYISTIWQDTGHVKVVCLSEEFQPCIVCRQILQSDVSNMCQYNITGGNEDAKFNVEDQILNNLNKLVLSISLPLSFHCTLN